MGSYNVNLLVLYKPNFFETITDIIYKSGWETTIVDRLEESTLKGPW